MKIFLLYRLSLVLMFFGSMSQATDQLNCTLKLRRWNYFDTQMTCFVQPPTEIHDAEQLSKPDTIVKGFIVEAKHQMKFLPENVGETFPELIVFRAEGSFKLVGKRNFVKMPNLKLLVLQNSEIVSIPNNTFDDLRKLKYLRLTSNRLVDVSEDLFGPLTNLKRLEIHDNKIQSLSEKTFTPLTKLEVLNLSKNIIKELHARLLIDLISLRIFDVSNNQLESLHVHFFANNAKLERIFLNDNNIQVLNMKIFASINSLNYVGLKGNPNINSSFPTYSKDLDCEGCMRNYLLTHSRPQKATKVNILSSESLFLITLGLICVLYSLMVLFVYVVKRYEDTDRIFSMNEDLCEWTWLWSSFRPLKLWINFALCHSNFFIVLNRSQPILQPFNEQSFHRR